MSAPKWVCRFGHLVWVGQTCRICEREIMIANIFNRAFEEWKMNNCDREHVMDPPNYVKYYCIKCTAHKRQGTIYCPFCGITEHYYMMNGVKVKGAGRIDLHLLPEVQAAAGRGLGASPSEEVSQDISSEEVQFNDAIKVVRKAFDNLKLCRKQRRHMEADCKLVQTEIDKLREDLAIARHAKPQPLAIGTIYGKDRNENMFVLGILQVDQGGLITNVTVRLP